ncbi:MAG: hypothetical protein M3R13_03925 [Armatimonadota bacterium]|nr:hypothetical protein [Armatimonadota bacterium]
MSRAKRIVHWASAIFLSIVAILSLFWIYVWGEYVLGLDSGVLPFLLALLPPLALCLWVYTILYALRVSSKVHLGVLVAATVLGIAFAWQPWSPRIQFVRNLNSIERCASEADVRKIMAGYLDAYFHETSDQYLPETLRNQGVTHCISYRWSNGRLDADIAEVFLKDGRVLGTRFLPD